MRSLKMKVSTDADPIRMRVSSGAAVRMNAGTAVETIDGPPYEGTYEVTPSDQVQTLETSGKLMHGNVTINPVPSNYGLIGWNGSVLTVS